MAVHPKATWSGDQGTTLQSMHHTLTLMHMQKNVLGHRDPLCKMLVAKVLTGLPFVSPPNRELRFPPERADTGAREGRVRRRYNSVQGTTGGSEVYITYSNEQAYPAYIISYIRCRP